MGLSIVHKVKKNCSKHPPTFGIDLLVDDSKGVVIESRKYNFKMIQVSPEDEDWHQKIILKVKEIEKFTKDIIPK